MTNKNNLECSSGWLEIENDFDCISYDSHSYTFNMFGSPMYLQNIIQNILSDRYIVVHIKIAFWHTQCAVLKKITTLVLFHYKKTLPPRRYQSFFITYFISFALRAFGRNLLPIKYF